MLYDITSKMQGIVSVIAPYKESEIIRAEQRDWLPTSSPFYDGNSGFVAVQRQWAINDGKTPEEARFQTEMPVAGRGGELKSTTRNTKPQTQKEIDKIGIPYNKSSNPFDPVQETDKFGNVKGKGWSETNTRFKVEGGQTTTQLGSGKGLEIFNRNIVDFQLINK